MQLNVQVAVQDSIAARQYLFDVISHGHGWGNERALALQLVSQKLQPLVLIPLRIGSQIQVPADRRNHGVVAIQDTHNTFMIYRCMCMYGYAYVYAIVLLHS